MIVGTYGRLDHGKNPFFIEIALGYGARLLPDSDGETGERQNRAGWPRTCRSRFPVSGIVGCRTNVGFFFFPSPAFLRVSLPPAGLSDLCSHRRKNKTQVALSGHHRGHGTWSTRCCRYLLPIEDTYLLVQRERNLFYPSGPRLPSCWDRTLSDMSRRSCKLVTDIMDVPLAYNPLSYKNHHVNCSDRNKNSRYCREIIFLRQYFVQKKRREKSYPYFLRILFEILFEDVPRNITPFIFF